MISQFVSYTVGLEYLSGVGTVYVSLTYINYESRLKESLETTLWPT